MKRAMWRRRRAPLPLAALSLALLHAHGALAQDAPAVDPPLMLKRTPQLTETLPPAERGQLPSFVDGDKLSGRPDLETIVEGHASMRRGDTVINADRLEYYQPDDLAKARGNVRVNQAGNVYEGPELELKLETFEGFFNNVRYRFLATGAHGDAERIDFVDSNVSVARQATYTTCRREDYPGWMPAWLLTAATLTTDSEENVGVATDARLSFMGISTPALPSMSFPLNNDRKTGFLPPTVGISSVNGIDITAPYYWNIAPNRDATFYPDLMSKRGVNLGSEFRYLEDKYSGQIRFDYMPTDELRDRKRWGLWTHHEQTFDPKPFGLDSLGMVFNINRVSDDNYWRDFTRTPSLTSRLLATNGALNWSKDDWSGAFGATKYQTLQYDASTITPPYDRLPQITANYAKYDWHGLDIKLATDYTRFRADPSVQLQPNGDRVFAEGEISRPLLSSGGFIIPKLKLHTASYQLDSALANGSTSASSTVPTFSLDSGLIFERDANFFGRAFRQTLEPRAYYVYTPYRNQSNLPIYDSASNDFNFATVYTENEFSGHDRVSATNALTVGLTTRLYDADTGAEAARFGIAQRYRIRDQDVTLPATGSTAASVASPAGVSDLLLGAQINWTSKWSLDTTFQYNADTHRSVRTAVTARYSPEQYHNLTASYRFQAPTTAGGSDGNKSIDVGFQWPLNDLWGDKGKDLGPGRGAGGGRWYAVGRLNYSIQDKTLTDGVLGFEYDGCCWIGRVVLERLSTGQVSAGTRLMFQLEFVGFASVGTSPLRTLTQNIQRYQPLRAPYPGASRFTNYD
ncbi:LPS-assembly protein [Variovorax sp. GrIS 2.14]|uniref:LPS-assembly protein LptD n=1 Tax=Variovorax sp. GrIS 2.14 TaxID=3071709 RepID=UPI0038F7F63E